VVHWKQARLSRLKKQRGMCAICGQSLKERRKQRELSPDMRTKTRACLDHNHQTAQLRGVLCTRCNLMVGQVESIPVVERERVIKELLRYLAYWNTQLPDKTDRRVILEHRHKNPKRTSYGMGPPVDLSLQDVDSFLDAWRD